MKDSGRSLRRVSLAAVFACAALWASAVFFSPVDAGDKQPMPCGPVIFGQPVPSAVTLAIGPCWLPLDAWNIYFTDAVTDFPFRGCTCPPTGALVENVTMTLPHGGGWYVVLTGSTIGTPYVEAIYYETIIPFMVPEETPPPTRKPPPAPTTEPTPKPTRKPRATPTPTASVLLTAAPTNTPTPSPTAMAVVEPTAIPSSDATPASPASQSNNSPRHDELVYVGFLVLILLALTFLGWSWFRDRPAKGTVKSTADGGEEE